MQKTLIQQLTLSITQSLHFHLPSNATFLAQHLLSQDPTQHNLNLLATCYLTQSKPHKAYQLLKSSKLPSARYNFAIACIRLNKYAEAEKALQWYNEVSKINKIGLKNEGKGVEEGGYWRYLLGYVYERRGKMENAMREYRKALEIDPAIWVAYEGLIRLGAFATPDKVFGKQEEDKKKDELAIMFGKRRNTEMEKAQAKQVNLKESIIWIKIELIPLMKMLAEPTFLMSICKCKQAIIKLKSLPTKHFNTSWTQFQIGEYYCRIGNYEEAQQAFLNGIKLQPARLQGIYHYALCLCQLSKIPDLIRLSDSVLKMAINSFQAWIVIGLCFERSNQNKHALNFYTRATYLNPYDPTAYTMCGRLHLQKKEFDQARKCYQKSITLNAVAWMPWVGMGNVAIEERRHHTALGYYKKATQINSQSAQLHFLYGKSLFLEQRFQLALASHQRSYVLSSQHRVSTPNTAIIFSKKPFVLPCQ